MADVDHLGPAFICTSIRTQLCTWTRTPTYGTERSYNGLRLAGALSRRDGVKLRVFLLGNAVGCAISGQKVPDTDAYYHLDRMIESAAGTA